MDINRLDVVEEVRRRFLQYEEAINTNDVQVLDDCFLNSPGTVRFGINETLWSFDEIKAFRRTPNTAGKTRNLERYVITTYGDTVAVANAVSTRDGVPKIGRQSQTWLKQAGTWKVVSAHVSLVDALK
ncbi:MAG: oxalurate catabolism protein HpxZ [Caldimonas sp.]